MLLPLGATPVNIFLLSSGVKLTKPPPMEAPLACAWDTCCEEFDDFLRDAVRLCGWEEWRLRVKRGWGEREGEREGGLAGPWPRGRRGVEG